jgi:uncharacterized protein (TIRG00374 family)
MVHRMRRRSAVFISVFFGIVLVSIWLFLVDIGEVFHIFRTIKMLLIFPLALLFILVYFLRSFRWKLLLSPVQKITASESFKLCMASYLINFLLPVHAGEVAKCLWLKKLRGTPVPQSLLIAYLDKLADLLPIFLLLIAAPFLDPRIRSIIYLTSGILVIFFSGIFLVLVLLARRRQAAVVLLEKTLFFFPHKLKIKLSRFMSLFAEGITFLPQLLPRLAGVISLTLLALVLHIALMWLYFYSFGITLPVLIVFVGYSLLNVSFLLPAPPGYSGSLELAMIFIFSYLFGYDKNVVSAVAASSHVFTAVLFGVVGLLSIALIGTRLSSLFMRGSDTQALTKEWEARAGRSQ